MARRANRAADFWRQLLLTIPPGVGAADAYAMALRLASVAARHASGELAERIVAAWLNSAKSAASGAKIPPTPLPGHWPVRDEAARWLASRGLADLPALRAVAEEARAAADAEMQRRAAESAREFALALADDVTRGGTLADFRKAVAAAADSTKMGARAVEQVYRDGVARAQAAGRAHVMADPRVSSHFPYRAWYAVHDSRAQPEHRRMESLGLDGTNVYRADDPVFDQFTPPVRPNCRCDVVALTVRQAAEEGVREAQRWLDTGEKPAGTRHLARPYPLPHIPNWSPTPSAKGPF